MIDQSVRLRFRYAVGAAGAFFDALRDDGRMLGSRCARCRRVACPARSFCVMCGAATPAMVEVGPSGALLSWTSIPGVGVYGLVALDGADGALLHKLLGPSERWCKGARVRAELHALRAGSILDIAGFRAEQP